MTTWAEQEAAINMRDIITRIADTRIESLRPTPTYAVVQTINREARSATVLHVGDTDPVSVAMGSIEPAQVGQTVRIGGLIGHRYVEDVLGNAIMSGNDTRYAPIAHTHTEGGATEFLLDDIGDVDTATNPPGPSSVLGWNDVGGYWQPVSMDLGTSYLSLGGGTVTGPTTFQSTLAVNQTLSVLGAVTGQSFTGVGTGLTFLNATELKSGTIPAARMPSTIPSSTTGTSAGWTTGRVLTMSGDVSGTVTIKGDADMTMSVALAANSIDLGTDTTGDYVRHIIGTANQIISNTVVANEGVTHTLSLPQSIHVSATPQFSRLTLGVATGTSPMAITSTTRNDNFTSHYLGVVGQDDAFFRNAGSLNAGTLANVRLSGPYTGITSVGTLSTLSVTGVAALGANSTIAGQTIWHAGNDGAGSGLDAGLLGGVLPVGYASTEVMESLLGDLLAVGLYNATAYNGQMFSMIFDRAVQTKITGLTIAPGDHNFVIAVDLDLPEISQIDLYTGENRRRIFASDSVWFDVARYGDDDYMERAVGYAYTPKTDDIQIDRPVVIRARVRKTDLDAPGVREIARHGSTTAAAYLNNFQTAITPDTPDLGIDGRVRFLTRFRFDSAAAIFGHTIYKQGPPQREWMIYTYGGGVAFSSTTTTGAQNDFGIASDMLGDHTIGAEVTPGSHAVVALVDGVRNPTTLGGNIGVLDTTAPVQVGGGFDGRIYWAQMEAIQRAQLQFPGVPGDYVRTYPGPRPTGDLEIVARVTSPNWSVYGMVAAMNGCYYLSVGPHIYLWSSTATASSYPPSPNPHGFVNGATGWIKAVRVAATGDTSFYCAPDSAQEPTTWTSLGTATGLAAGVLGNPDQPFELGCYAHQWSPFTGRIRQVILRDGIAGPALVNVNENDAGVMTTSTAFTATSGQTFDLYKAPKYEFPGIAGNYMTMPYNAYYDTSSRPMTIELDFDPQSAPRTYAVFFSRLDDADPLWQIYLDGSTLMYFEHLAAGGSVNCGSTALPNFPGGHYQAAVTRVINGANVEVRWFLVVGGAYVPWGATAIVPGVPKVSNSPIFIGDQSTSILWPYRGRIRRLSIKDGVGASNYPGGVHIFDFGEMHTQTIGATSIPAFPGVVTVNQTSGQQIVQYNNAVLPVIQPQPDKLIWRFDANEAATAGRYLTPTIGTATTPDPGPLPNEWTMIYKAGPGNLATTEAIAAQWLPSGSWLVSLNNTQPTITFQNGGTQVYTVAGPIPEGSGLVAFSVVNNDGVNSTITVRRQSGDGSWIQVGAIGVAGPVTALNDSPDVVRIGALLPGSYVYSGPIYSVEMRTGLSPVGGSLLWRFDADEAPTDGSLSWTDPRGRTWTLTAAGAISPISVGRYLTPTVGKVTAPDPGPPPGEFTIAWKQRGSSVLATSHNNIIGQWTGQPSWALAIDSNSLVMYVSSTGSTYSTMQLVHQSQMPTLAPDGTIIEMAVTVQQTDGTNSRFIPYIRNISGAWEQASATVLGAPLALWDSIFPIEVGQRDLAPITNFHGDLYYVEMRNGLNPNSGTVRWRFDADEAPTDGSLSWTDPRGRTWTMAAAGAISPAIPNQYTDPRGRTWTLSSPTAIVPQSPDEAWTLYMDSGKLALRASPDGAMTSTVDVMTAAELDTISGTADGSDFYVAAAIKLPGTTLDVQGWGSPNGNVWTPVGIPKSTSFRHTSLYASSAGLYIGGQSGTQRWDGRIYWADMVAGGTPNTVDSPVWSFDSKIHVSGYPFDSGGRTWTLSPDGSINHPVYQFEAAFQGSNGFRSFGGGGFYYSRSVGRRFHAQMFWNSEADNLGVGFRNAEGLDDLHAAVPAWNFVATTYPGDVIPTMGVIQIGTRIGGTENWAFNGRMHNIWITKNGALLLDLTYKNITAHGQMTVMPTTGPLMTFSHNTMAATTMPKPVWAEGPTVYRHNMYWIVASGGEIDFVDSDLSGRYEVDVDDAVTVANGDWIVAIDPLFGAPGHEEGADLTLSQMVFQYIPFSAETFVKAKIQEHLSDTLDPHSAAGYLKTVIANTLYAPLVHTHEAEISGFISLHEAALDPHPGYLTQAEANGYYLKPGDLLPYEPQGAILAHEQKSDPHPQYVTHAEANQDYAVVDHLHNQYAQEGHTHSQFYEIAATDGAQSARLFIGDDLPFEPRVGDLWIQTFDISLQPPAAPTNLVVSATTPTTIRLSWNTWDATVEQQSVQVERSPNGSTGWVQVFVDGGSPAATTFTDITLPQRTTFFYRVRATNLTGPGTWRYINAATGNAPPPPPTGLFVNNRTGDSVRLNWTAVTAPGNDPMHVSAPYELFRNGTFVATTADVFYDFAGLAENTEYILGVRSKDNVGVVSVLVTINSGLTANSGPPTPTGLASLDAGTNHIYLQWTPVTGISDFKEYWIRWTYYGIVTTTASSMLFSGLAPATNYSFEVAAVDTDGVASAYSPVFTTSTLGAADSTPPGPITNVSFKPRNNYGEMWFEFTAPGDVAFGQISYNVNGKEWIRVYQGGMSGANNRLIGTFAAGSTVYVSLSYRDIAYNWYYSPNYSYTLVASPSSFSPHSSNSWRPTNGGEWNAQGDYKVVEGYHSNSGLNSRGFWFYGSDFQTWWQTGRTITSARMFIAREGCGADQQDMITMYRHKLDVSPGTQSYYGNAPEFSSDSHEAGTVQYNDSKWMDIPLAWASSLCAGTWRGIGIANAGKPYACLHQSGFGNSGLIELTHLG